jgi:uncharacterized SAM-binding protein YcdF (DUF218 family)
MTTATLPRRRKALRWAAVVVAVLAVGWLVAGYLVIGRPATDRPTAADAIVVLGSPTAQDRLTTARRLVDAGVSKNLVISLFAEDQPVTQQRYCAAPPAGFDVFCFRPDPGTTRGEARYVSSLAAEHSWHNIVVVTSTYHVSRARLIFQRCFGGRLQMVGTSHGTSVGKWAYEFLYQTGAYVKAVVQSGC